MISLCTLYDVYIRKVHIIVIPFDIQSLTDNASPVLFHGEIVVFTCPFMDFLAVTLENVVD